MNLHKTTAVGGIDLIEIILEDCDGHVVTPGII